MTDKVYWREMYRRDMDAFATDCSESGIILDRTVFYPTGGGQPNDTGKITFNGKTVNIVDVKKSGEEVLHIPEGPVEIAPGTKVHCEIDWDRRYSHMRHHSAIHVIDGILAARHGSEALLTGGQIYQDHARIDINMEEFSREFVESLLKECNTFMTEGHRVYQREITREEVLSIPNLSRTQPGRELIRSLEKVRTIVIEDLDEQADGGTHVENTKEIGMISLTGIQSKGRRNKRIEFTLV